MAHLFGESGPVARAWLLEWRWEWETCMGDRIALDSFWCICQCVFALWFMEGYHFVWEEKIHRRFVVMMNATAVQSAAPLQSCHSLICSTPKSFHLSSRLLAPSPSPLPLSPCGTSIPSTLEHLLRGKYFLHRTPQ